MSVKDKIVQKTVETIIDSINEQLITNMFVSLGNWLEDITAEDIEKIIKAMTESRILGNDLNAGIKRNPDPNDSKKK